MYPPEMSSILEPGCFGILGGGTRFVRAVALPVQLVREGCRGAMDGRLLLRAASPDRLDVDLDLGRVGPRGILVGECLLPSKASRIFVGLIMERLAVGVTLYGACLRHHSRYHAGEHKRRYRGDDDQNDCVGSDVGPLVL